MHPKLRMHFLCKKILSERKNIGARNANETHITTHREGTSKQTLTLSLLLSSLKNFIDYRITTHNNQGRKAKSTIWATLQNETLCFSYRKFNFATLKCKDIDT